MINISEMKNNYILYRCFRNRVHKDSLFTIEIYPHVVAEFGEPKSKFKSKQYHLTKLLFDKKFYSKDEVINFWSNFHIKYIHYEQKGKKLAPIYRVLGNTKELIHGGYVVVYKNTSQDRETIKKQGEYDFWKEKFYDLSGLSSDKKAINAAIPLLIDRIKNSTSVLQQVPYSDHRIFEELVAEIFNGFGYSIELTKKTRDGGKDIIALRRNTNKSIEEKILIECKYWKDKKDVNTIRNLIGVAVSQDELPIGIMLATTSHFTSDAKKLTLIVQ